jgi:hypothetical protein
VSHKAKEKGNSCSLPASLLYAKNKCL